MRKEIKAALIEVLIFIKLRKVVKPIDLMNEFHYSYWGAVNRIRRMEKQNLVEKMGSINPGAYCLTNEGIRRLLYYDDRRRKDTATSI